MGELLSMVLFGEGLLTGLTLTLMLGPVTMIILRNGLEINRAAGIWAAAGTWVSDFGFIAITYLLTFSVKAWANDPDVRLSLYIIGGCGLMLMGLLMTRIKKKPIPEHHRPTTIRYTQSFISGFVVNSLSPFTLFFWLGAAVFVRMQSEHPLYYYVGLMLSLAAGDFTKAWLAPKLNVWLKDQHVYWIQVIAGFVIAGAGGYILYLGIVG
jgi:threonine/homoserine/homoserine lactone efflux protein